jgi:hypothetical protein
LLHTYIRGTCTFPSQLKSKCKWLIYGKTSMSDWDPKMGLILYRLKPASTNSPCHFSSLSSPVVSIIMHTSIRSWALRARLDATEPATVSMFTTFPFGPLAEIASFDRFKILTQSSSLQLWRTHL